ncbi:MAG: hypothetical protein R8G33_03015 [Gammaproteobacteria bacterium]|nr:hypothetical protein [Gammaproteobacteria bacterium]
MDKNIHSRWLTILHPLFPENALLTSNSQSNDFLVTASWKLNNPKYSGKKSRTVVIEVPQETVNDYSKKSETRQIYDDQKLYKQAKEFLHLLNPDHDTPSDKPPPEVRLVACGTVLDS